MLYISVFLVTVAVDFAWTKYIAEAAAKRALPAALWSSAIVILAACTTFAYVEDKMTAIPAALGAFFGTYYAVWRENRKG